MIIEIDDNSGFCFGVVNAIQKAEFFLENNERLYCLGDIVHNNMEVERLKKKGLETIGYEKFNQLKDTIVLIRAHGEPPETYKIALKNNITLIDATCPVVLKLQENIKKKFEQRKDDQEQIVIFGKPNHAEVNGLVGQTGGKAIVINDEKDLDKVDFTKPVSLFSQTTRGKEDFERIRKAIEQCVEKQDGDKTKKLYQKDTTCNLVSKRKKKLIEFACKYDIIIFVSGKKSSNGKMLFELVNQYNQNSYLISKKEEIQEEWFETASSVGICGATSTPRWLMEEVATSIEKITAKE